MPLNAIIKRMGLATVGSDVLTCAQKVCSPWDINDSLDSGEKLSNKVNDLLSGE